MEEPGGEMEASDRRLCCEVQTDREKKERGECTRCRNYSFHFTLTFLFQTLSHPESPLCPRRLLA